METLKRATRELEPGFAGLSFQVICRNPRAYALYREAADGFTVESVPDKQPRSRRRRRRRDSAGQPLRSSYDPLQRFDKKELVQRIRSTEAELEAATATKCACL